MRRKEIRLKNKRNGTDIYSFDQLNFTNFPKMDPSPSPFLFNPWKHHLLFLKEKIREAREIGIIGSEAREGMVRMGESRMDLYTGDLPISRITEELKDGMPKEWGTPEAFRKDIQQKDGYSSLTVSDGSIWIFTEGEMPDRPYHIHPARWGPLSIRVKSSTLKTAFLVLVEAHRYKMSPLDKSLIDQVRTTHLGLSPLKRIQKDKGLGKLIGILAPQTR